MRDGSGYRASFAGLCAAIFLLVFARVAAAESVTDSVSIAPRPEWVTDIDAFRIDIVPR